MCNPKVQIQRAQALLSSLPAAEAASQLDALFESELRLFAALYGGSAEARLAAVRGQLGSPALEAFHVQGWREGKREAWDFLCWLAARLRTSGEQGDGEGDARLERMREAAAEPMNDTCPDRRAEPCGSI